MVTIIDYGTGNLRSITNALTRLGSEFRLTDDPREIRAAERVLLPGVGEAATAMEQLRNRNLAQTLRELTQPTLGICLGMQLLCRHSDEGDVPCLDIFPNRVLHFTDSSIKVPHVGWNSIYNLQSPLYDGIDDGSYVYYVHSYFAEMSDAAKTSNTSHAATITAATTDYPTPFSGSLCRANYYGCQFHPEKSGSTGERILANFLKI